MRRLKAVEGLPLEVDAVTAQAVRQRLVALKDELAPRIPFLAGTEANLVVQNLVGSVQVTPDLVLDVVPKTRPEADWARAVIDLVVDERAHYGGETDSAESTARVVLPDAFARLYAEQLERAVRREGPLAVLEQRRRTRPELTGRLNVTRWLTTRITNPAEFPQSQSELTADNAFTSAMCWVADALAARTRDPLVATRLRALPARLRPGLPPRGSIDPGIALRPIPSQWRAYAPAWATAASFLRRIAPLHRSGTLDGFGLAVEPWPLLERLLHRGLRAAAAAANAEGVPLRAVEHAQFPMLVPEPRTVVGPLTRLHGPRKVDPDGSLWLGDTIVATFEAKYSVPSSDSFRDHYFQALCTAAALDSPLAVVIYPEPAPAVSWEVTGFAGKPARLVALGVDMYGYRQGPADVGIGNMLLDVARSAAATAAAGVPSA